MSDHEKAGFSPAFLLESTHISANPALYGFQRGTMGYIENRDVQEVHE
ncbi:hypothetical protein [Borborobacter arsenicus]|nr:hypothetical protein [Pseudaminobacter arsenicus]